MGNPYGRSIIVPLTNKSGGSVAAGDIVILDSSNNDAFTTTTSANVTTPIGIAQQTIANNAVGLVLLEGYASLVNVNASVTRLHYGATYTVAKQATDAGAARAAGTFCVFLTGGTTPDAYVYPVDLAGSALTNPMTTSQDIIVGGSSGTPGRLAVGAAGGALSVINSAVAWNSGTSMPGSKATGDRYWRTDLGLEAYWDGTRWLTTTLYRETLGISSQFTGLASGNQSIGRLAPWAATYDLWLDAFYTTTYVATTNNGTNFWTLTLQKADSADSKTSIVSFTTASDTVNNWTQRRTSIAASYTASSFREFDVQAVATLSPGALYWGLALAYRLILT